MVKLMKESLKVLQECAELQVKKSEDYQNGQSNVTQAMHYRRGIDSIHDIINGKILRAQSLLESPDDPNFENLESINITTRPLYNKFSSTFFEN